MMKKFLTLFFAIMGIFALYSPPGLVAQCDPTIHTTTDSTHCGNNDGSVTVDTVTTNLPGDTMVYTVKIFPGLPVYYSTPHTFSGLSPGAYVLITTNQDGCTGTKEVYIGPSMVRTGDIITSISCGSNTGTLTALASEPNFASYSWSNLDTTVTITGNASQSYTVEISWNDGCTLLLQDSLPEFEPVPNIVFSPNGCQDTIGTLCKVSPLGGTLYWNGDPFPNDCLFDAHTDSVYAYIYQGALGCVDTGLFYTPSPKMPPNLSITITDSVSCTIGGSISATVDSIMAYAFCMVNLITGDTIAFADSVAIFTADSLDAGSYGVYVFDPCGCMDGDTVTLSGPLMPYITFNKVNAKCGQPNGSATATVANGKDPISYLWLPGGMTTMDIDSLYADTYILTATDANGCSTTAAVIVNDDPCPPGMWSDTTVIFCWADSAMVNGIVYTETGIDTQFVINPIYPLVTDTLVVFAVELPEALVVSDTSYTCGTVMSISETIDTLHYASIDCDSVILKHILITNPISYSVDSVGICSGDTLIWQSLQITTAGVYLDTTVNQYGCDSIMTLTVTLNQSFQLSIETMTCIGDSVEYNGDFYQAGVYTILLPGMNTCDTMVTLSVAEYPFNIVTVTDTVCELGLLPTIDTLQDLNGCDYIRITNYEPVLDSVFVTKYSCTIPPGTVTKGIINNQTGCDSILVITWQAGSSKSVTFNKVGCVGDPITVAGNNVVFQQDTVFVATSNYVNPDTGCDSTVTEVISIHPNPQYEVGVDQPDCNTDGALKVSPKVNGNFYDWSPGGMTTPEISGLGPGVYTVNVTDPNGCDDEKSVTIVPYAPIQIDTILDHPICDGSHLGSIQLNISGGSGNLSVLWSDGSTELFRNNLQAGKYSVVVIDDNAKGCYQTMEIQLGALGCRLWHVQQTNMVFVQIGLCHVTQSDVPFILEVFDMNGKSSGIIATGVAYGGKLPETMYLLPHLSSGTYSLVLTTYIDNVPRKFQATIVVL